jgi:hypothetical protein
MSLPEYIFMNPLEKYLIKGLEDHFNIEFCNTNIGYKYDKNVFEKYGLEINIDEISNEL